MRKSLIRPLKERLDLGYPVFAGCERVPVELMRAIYSMVVNSFLINGINSILGSQEFGR